MTALDRPVWHTLTTHLAHLSVGNDQARRFHPDVNMFLSGRDDSAASMQAAADLLARDETAYILQAPAINLPPTLIALKAAQGVQMVYAGGLPELADADIIALTNADAADMLALATLTEPGPFLARTHEMGQFFGVKQAGRLVAMAGERMRFPGFTEVSGVCTHPEFQGRGYAKRLSAHVAQTILDRGETPFLHAWASNAAAIGLYESLGFSLRCDVNAAIVKRS